MAIDNGGASRFGPIDRRVMSPTIQRLLLENAGAVPSPRERTRNPTAELLNSSEKAPAYKLAVAAYWSWLHRRRFLPPDWDVQARRENAGR